MVYQNKFVAIVKANGKILRERNGDEVFLPFGSEYSLLLKNLNSRTAKVNISIDGSDVLDGSSLIIYPNTDLELVGFLKGNTIKNKFKFIEKTEEISQHRGDKIDDGLIRIEVFFEKSEYKFNTHYHHYHHYYDDWYYYPLWKPYEITWWRSHSNIIDNTGLKPYTVYTSSCDNLSLSNNVSDNFSSCYNANVEDKEGITVKGSEVEQEFNNVDGYLFEDMSEVIVIKLKGTDSRNKKIEKPVTVDGKLKCKTCGKVSKSSSKFCSNCGTFLE